VAVSPNPLPLFPYPLLVFYTGKYFEISSKLWYYVYELPPPNPAAAAAAAPE